MFTPMARLLLLRSDGQDPNAPGGRVPSIATENCLALPPRSSVAAQFCGASTIQHFTGTPQRTVRDGCSIEHYGQFLLPGRIVEGLDDGYDASVPLALGDLEMQVPERGDLGKMGYDDDLMIRRQGPERFTDDLT